MSKGEIKAEKIGMRENNSKKSNLNQIVFLIFQ